MRKSFFCPSSYSPSSYVLRIILVVVKDGHFFDVGLEDLGLRTGFNNGLEPIRPSSYSLPSYVLPIILVVVEDGLGELVISENAEIQFMS